MFMVMDKDFKIRRKSDTKRLLELLSDGEWYYETDDDYDYCISKCRGRDPYISCRHKSLRGNLFNPYIACYVEGKNEYDSLHEIMWKHRKYLNKWYAGGCNCK